MVVIRTTAKLKCAEGTSEINHCRKPSTLGRASQVGLWENQVRAEREILGLNLESSRTLLIWKLFVPSKPKALKAVRTQSYLEEPSKLTLKLYIY